MPISDYVLDNGLASLAGANRRMDICKSEPTTYADATTDEGTGGSAVCTSSTVGEVPNALPGQGTIHRLSGGVDGEICEILLHIVTSGLDEFDQTVYLPIRNQ